MDASKREPMPIKGNVDILPLVIKDLKSRDIIGTKKYGTPLQSHNGRDSLIDAYHEILDLCMYLRQQIEERNNINFNPYEFLNEKLQFRPLNDKGENDGKAHYVHRSDVMTLINKMKISYNPPSNTDLQKDTQAG